MFRSLLLKVTKEISRNIRSPQKTNERNSSITKIVKGESDVTKDKEDNKPNKLPQRILYDTNEILENHYSKGIYITAFSEYGFRLSNSICAIGPIVLFPRSVFHWNIESVAEISEESLCMFHIVTPKIDTLIIGAGDQQVQPAISKQIFNFMRKHKINVEIHPTEQACTTFNYLNREGRMAAAALIPPVIIKFSDDDRIATQNENNDLYLMGKSFDL